MSPLDRPCPICRVSRGMHCIPVPSDSTWETHYIHDARRGDFPAIHVYISDIGTLSAPFCEVGRRIVSRRPVAGMTGCSTRACVCGDEGERFRPAVADEARGFWEALGDMAGQALAEREGDL